MCVQKLDDSLNSAIHINYRISLRSSSMPEPRDPLLKVLTYLVMIQNFSAKQSFAGHRQAYPRLLGRASRARGKTLSQQSTTCRGNNRYVHMGLEL